MSQSFSESSLSENINEERKHASRPQSEHLLDNDIFEFDSKDFEKDVNLKTLSAPAGGFSDIIPDASCNLETPTKSKKKFTIPKIFSRSATPSSSVVVGSLGKEEAKSETPKRTVRSLFTSYVSKNVETDLSPSPPKELGPFPDEDHSSFKTPDTDTPQHNNDGADTSGEIEEGVDATQMSLDDESNTINEGQPMQTSPLESIKPLKPKLVYNPPPPFLDLCSPILVAILAVVNLLLSSWISGFLSGLVIAGVATYWICCYLTPSVSYSSLVEPTASTDKIEIHEPPSVFQAWMNLLPPQFQPYDVDTYEVKNTVSVRISVEHHMMKIEYPETNIPKRLNTDEIIPNDISFLYHSDHIDLTKAKISLLPDGIAGKRMFSKKYPIEIRTNGLANNESQQPTSLIKNRKYSRSKESINSDDSENFKDVLGTPTKQAPTLEAQDNKSFYLFARADREKEDIYKFLIDSHHFLTDTVLDVARRDGAIVDGIDRDAGGRETVRERKSKFNDFMDRVIENSKKESKEDPTVMFLNVYLNRIFYDIHKSEEVKSMLKTRVYNKLLKIKITQWFKSIELTEINMGKTLPKVCWISNLHQDSRGLWVELGVNYDGIASATIETCGLIIGDEIPDSGSGAVNLKALLDDNESALPVRQREQTPGRKTTSRIVAATNSDEEDSAEEDSDDSQELDLPIEQVVGVAPTGTTSEIPINKSRWWEVVGNSDMFKKGIDRLSKTEWFKQKNSKKITLHLELACLNGVVVLNIPPPPTDRLWYSFKTRPELELRIEPFYGGEKLGNDNTFSSRAFNKIIDIVTQRLKEEIHKFILMPNMDDIPIKIMDPFPSSNEKKN